MSSKVRHVFNQLVIILLIGILSVELYAQDEQEKRGYGISAIFNGEQFDFDIPIWVRSKFVVAPAFGYISVQDIGKELLLGVTFRRYSKIGTVSPYAGFRVGAIFGIPESGDTSIDKIIGVLWGGEYSFSDNFSIGIEDQGNFVFLENNSGFSDTETKLSFNTATVIIANIYF